VRTVSGEAEARLSLGASEAGTVGFRLTPPSGLTVRRARVAADVTIGGQPFGQQAEALVTVVDAEGGSPAGADAAGIAE
jgi:hypothetical protein